MALRKDLNDYCKRVKTYATKQGGNLEAIAAMMIQEAEYMGLRLSEIRKLLDVIDSDSLGITEQDFRVLPKTLKDILQGPAPSENPEEDLAMEDYPMDEKVQREFKSLLKNAWSDDERDNKFFENFGEKDHSAAEACVKVPELFDKAEFEDDLAAIK